MAAPQKPTTPASTGPADDTQSPTNDSWLDASKLLERAQKEATSLLERAQKEAAALLGRAKDNPKIAAGIAAGAAATIAGGAYAAKKMRSGTKTTKPRTAGTSKPAARKPAARKPSPAKKS